MCSVQISMNWSKIMIAISLLLIWENKYVVIQKRIFFNLAATKKRYYALNHYLLIAKYYIYRAKNQSETPNLKVFLALPENKIKCERQMAIKNSNCKNYEAKWLSAFATREAFSFSTFLCKCFNACYNVPSNES